MDRKDIYEMIEREIVANQEGKGKAMTQEDGKWLGTFLDYLGRAVRRMFADEGINDLMLMKCIAVGISWLADDGSRS